MILASSSSITRVKALSTVAPKAAKLQVDPQAFISFLKLSFGQKRKTFANNLKQSYSEDRIKSAIAATSLRPDVRAEALSLEQFAKVFHLLSNS